MAVRERRSFTAAVSATATRPPTFASDNAPRVAHETWLALQGTKSLGARSLQRLAGIAQQFTSRVSLEPPDAILLEVRGSLALFGGLQKLRGELLERSHAALEGNVTLHAACAPTPLAALVLARAAMLGRSSAAVSHRQLAGTLAPLPLALLRWPPPVLRRLESAGVRSIGEVLRLPRDGFAKRFGIAALQDLDRLVGRSREIRRNFTASERFHRKFDVDFELVTHAQLMALLAPVFVELERFLQSRQCGIESLALRLVDRTSETRLRVRVAQATFEVRRFAHLLEHKLARVSLSTGVKHCELRSSALQPIVLVKTSLWAVGEHGADVGEESPLLVERLRAKLGDEAVYGLCLVPEHRPERASAIAEPSLSAPMARGVALGVRRPLWLLQEPVRLPRAPQGLQLLEGPERIETGWWDGSEVARDYYIARDTQGAELWVFREREPPHAWFLHGVLA